MGVNKVVYGTTVLVDLTEDTVIPERLISGYTAHDKTGVEIVGVATGEATRVGNLEELQSNYDSEEGFLISYDNATNGITYITNTVTTSKGIYEETTSTTSASTWWFELVSGYTDRFYVYTIVNDEKLYMFNNTNAGANFMGLSATEKAIFIISYADIDKFYFKISTGNKWLQHSNGVGGMRLYIYNNTAANSQLSLTYKVNSIVPYGTLTITENGTYDVGRYKTVIINI